MKAEVLRAAKVATTIIGAGVLAIALLAAAVFAYSFLRGEARIGVTCSVGGLLSRNSCQFTNTGSGAGSSCVVVTLRNRASGASIESQPTCSGEVPAGDSIERAVMFIDRTRPFQLCPGDMERSCDMEIVMLDEAGRPRRSSRPASPPPNTADAVQLPSARSCALIRRTADEAGPDGTCATRTATAAPLSSGGERTRHVQRHRLPGAGRCLLRSAHPRAPEDSAVRRPTWVALADLVRTAQRCRRRNCSAPRLSS